MKYEYVPKGVCSRQMILDVENGVLKDISIMGGCNGNLKGICSLVIGMSCDEVKSKLSGIRCGLKSTSCPDQLTRAIDAAIEAGAR